MTVEQFYESVGGDCKTALTVFKTEERIQKYLKKYASDEYYSKLCEAVEQGDIKEAFEAAHALKGLTGMFYLTDLYEAVVSLVEQLRPQNAPVDPELFQIVKKEQERILEAIAQIDD